VAAVPVEVATVESRSISSFIETNGTLEAENEVDLVARIAGPIVELNVEEGMKVGQGDLLARIDDRELRARTEGSQVALQEAQQARERSKSMFDDGLISREVWEQAVTRHETARAQYESDVILLGYTEIRAPFDALIVTRYVQLAEHVAVNAPLFRVSDFDPLLCKIQVPEKDVPKLRVGQRAYLVLEAWPDRRFAARVLRIRPVVDVATGTVQVTLEVATSGVLRPGMFARVFVETERHDRVLVIPKTLGFREGDFVEVTSGLAAGEQIVVFGQDGLSDGTPIQIMNGESAPAEGAAAPPGSPPRTGGAADPSQPTPERIERMKERMRERGLSEEEIEERLRRLRERTRE
jgi:membrane fusion protein (multidrug efflux system)